MALSLRLVSVLPHDLLEGHIQSQHLRWTGKSKWHETPLQSETPFIMMDAPLLLMTSIWCVLYNTRTYVCMYFYPYWKYIYACIHTHLWHNIDGTHNELVQVTISHYLGTLGNWVLESGPNPAECEKTDWHYGGAILPEWKCKKLPGSF